MCGRFCNDALRENLVEAFDIPLPESHVPCFNICLGTDVLTIIPGMAVMLRWGLVPRWAADTSRPLINVRGETLFRKFRIAAHHGRCLIPATAYYEWERGRNGKQPFAFAFPGRKLFALAAIRDDWMNPATGEALSSVSIVTTHANDRAAKIHERMPVLLSESQWNTWLSPENPRQCIEPLLNPSPAHAMEQWKIAPRINSPTNDDARLLDPILPPPTQGSLL